MRGILTIVRIFHLIFSSRISALAALSLVIVLCAAFWRVQSFIYARVAPTYVAAANTPTDAALSDASFAQEMMLLGLSTSSDPSATSETDPIAMIGPLVIAQLVGQYAGLLDTGGYSDERGTAAAEVIAEGVRAAISYKTHSTSEFKTDSNTSFDRMLEYRSDMREALAPLLENTQSEFEIYGAYIETSDPAHLETLRTVANRYQAAAASAAAITVPRDAVNYHKDIRNALEYFAATLHAMASHPEDAFASIALLRSYNDAEQKVFYAFDSLSNYYGQKLP